MRRLFVCDPICIQNFGHNVAALAYYRDMLGEFFDEVICLSSKHLSEKVAIDNSFERYFEYIYSDFMPVSQFLEDSSGLSFQPHKMKEVISERDLTRLLEKYNIGPNDAILYPSVDFYSIIALSNCVDKLVSRKPTVYLRFIGTMEYATKSFISPMDMITACINTMVGAGLDLRLSAETPKYADFIALKFRHEVLVTTYFETSVLHDLPKNKTYNVACPGSARHDKGFFNLQYIFSEVRKRDPDIEITFTTQLLPDRDLKHHQLYHAQLYAIPGIEILPSELTKLEIEAIYKNANLIMLPYDVGTYSLRGSAVMAEAAYCGRPVLALPGTAFGEQLRYYNLGRICADLNSIVEAIFDYKAEPISTTFYRSKQSRRRFITDSIASYRAWIS